MNRSRRLALQACVATPLIAASMAEAGSAAPGSAATPASSSAMSPMPVAVATELPGARLAGQGELRWFGLRVYTAQLWVGAESASPERFSAATFALQLQYGMSLAGQAIADRSLQEMARMAYGDAERRDRWHGAMKALFPDVGRGERLTGIHRPGRATAFYFGGQGGDRRVGEVEDPQFGPAFFAIWLDERTVAPDLRRQLLYGAARG